MNSKELFKEKKYVVAKHLIRQAIKLDLSLNEFLLLMYFENTSSDLFDVEKMCSSLGLKEEEIMIAFNNLINKKIIEFKSDKDEDGKLVDKISLDKLYEKVEEEFKDKQSDDLFAKFESEFARTLSPSEYEYINAFLDQGFSEELILGALKEAVYNGATNMRYIDSVLHGWKKKGLTTYEDVKNNNIKEDMEDTREIFDYDWLNENE